MILQILLCQVGCVIESNSLCSDFMTVIVIYAHIIEKRFTEIMNTLRF